MEGLLNEVSLSLKKEGYESIGNNANLHTFVKSNSRGHIVYDSYTDLLEFYSRSGKKLFFNKSADIDSFIQILKQII